MSETEKMIESNEGDWNVRETEQEQDVLIGKIKNVLLL